MTATDPEPPPAETFGLPACDEHLIAKLRNMDPTLRDAILTQKAATP